VTVAQGNNPGAMSGASYSIFNGEFFCRVSLTGKENFYEQKGFGTLTLDERNEGSDPDICISILFTMGQIERPSR
jgi:hypothetical protein